MPASTADNPVALRRLTTGALLLITLLALLLGAFHPGTAQPASATRQEASVPPRNSDPTVRVTGRTGLLTARQFRSLNQDLDRLAQLGTESVIYIRTADDEATAAPWFAEDLRIGWGVETRPGARDGLVVVVSIDRDNSANATVATSAGANAFPIRRLQSERFDQFVTEQVLPQIQAGETYAGLDDLVQMTLGTVVDRAGVLTERQRQTLDGDLRRLGELGLPLMVLIQPFDPEAEPPEARAGMMLTDWAVESEAGASDGVVLVVTIDAGNPEASTIVHAAGENAFPIRQLTAGEYATILQEQALPEVRDGDPYLGLAYAVRGAINYAEYSPPMPAPHSAIQESAQSPLAVAAAVLVQVAAIGYLLIPALVDRRLTLTPSPRSMTAYVLVVAALAIVVGALGVFGHSRVATLTGLGVFVWAIVVAPLLRAALNELSARLQHRLSPSAPADGGASVH